MPVLLFSQTISPSKYPQKIFLNGDTVCAISLFQVKQMNLSFIDLRFYRSLSDSFRVINKQQDFLVKEQDKLINACGDQLKIKQGIIDTKGLQIMDLKLLDKTNTRKIKWLSVQRNVLAVAVLVAAVKIFLIH